MNNNKRPQKPGKIAYNLALLLSAGIIAAVFLYMMVFSLFFKRTEISSYDKELTSMPEFTLDSFFPVNIQTSSANISPIRSITVMNSAAKPAKSKHTTV